MNQKSITSWNCLRMCKVQKEWESLDETARKVSGEEAAEKYGLKNEKLNEMLDAILKDNLSYDDLRNLTATCGTLLVRSKDRSDFDNAVLAYMGRTFVDNGDRDNLVKLLSTRCQLQIYPQLDIEFYLAGWGKKLKDPILVLGEAFTKCQVPEVRHDIAGAVRRGFVGQGIQGKDDAEYVKNAMQWYDKEKEHLTINWAYDRNRIFVTPEDYDDNPKLYDIMEKNIENPGAFKTELLFEKKPSKEKE